MSWSARCYRRLGCSRRQVLVAGVLLLTGCGSSRRDRFMPADTTTDPYASVRAQADEHFRQGQELYRQGEFRRALDRFQQARLYDPNPRPEIDEMIRRTQHALANGPVQPTAGPAVAAATTSPTAAATATTPTQRVDDGALPFSSRIYNYAITYPAGWRAEGATTKVGQTLLDSYTEERENGASAIIFSFAPTAGASQDGLIRQSLALRQKEGTPWKRQGVRPVDQAQAVVVTYTEQREDGAWLAVRQAVFLLGGLCWVVAVAAPLPDSQRHAGVLDQMLDSFRLGPASR